MGAASLVLGIIALVVSVGCGAMGLGWVGSICGILAIIFGSIAKKDEQTKGQGTAGVVCGVISLIWGIIATIACVACIGAVAAAGSNL